MGKKKGSNSPALTEAQKLQAKKDAFTRVVPQRVDNAIKAIRLVSQCASPNYSSTDIQKQAIIVAIENEVKLLKEFFKGNGKQSGGFKLPD
ncbi:unnamed protein product [marine sediment metagenome]|uniref:Uncharacterized protein n=1 Tax=marine sediment metagenome TaxID=412755 RepID=X1SRT8_9ZZZZ